MKEQPRRIGLRAPRSRFPRALAPVRGSRRRDVPRLAVSTGTRDRPGPWRRTLGQWRHASEIGDAPKSEKLEAGADRSRDLARSTPSPGRRESASTSPTAWSRASRRRRRRGTRSRLHPHACRLRGGATAGRPGSRRSRPPGDRPGGLSHRIGSDVADREASTSAVNRRGTSTTSTTCP